jgi:predicted Zn-dependent peptidase
MFVEIRDNRNLSYGAFSLNSKQKEFGLFTAAMDVTPARAPEAIEVALQVIKATLTEKIAEDELSRALKSAQKTALFVSDSSQSYTQYLMGRMMADLETDLDVINEKIVLAAQLDWQDTMLQYFTKNNLTLGIAGEPGDAEEQWGSIVEATL